MKNRLKSVLNLNNLSSSVMYEVEKNNNPTCLDSQRLSEWAMMSMNLLTKSVLNLNNPSKSVFPALENICLDSKRLSEYVMMLINLTKAFNGNSRKTTHGYWGLTARVTQIFHLLVP